MTEEKRSHVYRLSYDDGRPDEQVRATGPTEAVAARTGGTNSLLPSGIEDETLTAEWIARRATARGATTIGDPTHRAPRDENEPRFARKATRFPIAKEL